ncbi:ComF family protein [Paenibacillus pinisoli]|nr:ComF family protein [Paenibacillus pinisoli]
MSGVGKLKSILRSAGERPMEWLSPTVTGCMICGKTVLPHHGSSYRERGMASYRLLRQCLCVSCFASIPWLDRIQCEVCGRGVDCGDCIRRPERHFVCNRSAVGYSSVMREWLAMYKYRGQESLAPMLAEMLVPSFLRLTEEQWLQRPQRGEARTHHGLHRLKAWMDSFWHPYAEAARRWDAITYVPVSRERAQERGFNQAQQVAGFLSDKLGIPGYDLLIRDRHAEKMSFKTRAERQRDSRTLFTGNEGQIRRLENQSHMSSRESLRILLIDDIYTTGSTAEACASAIIQLASRPVQLYILTWARS